MVDYSTQDNFLHRSSRTSSVSSMLKQVVDGVVDGVVDDANQTGSLVARLSGDPPVPTSATPSVSPVTFHLGLRVSSRPNISSPKHACTCMHMQHMQHMHAHPTAPSSTFQCFSPSRNIGTATLDGAKTVFECARVYENRR